MKLWELLTVVGGLGTLAGCFFTSVIFGVLKITEVIDWSWFWVMAPIFVVAVIGSIFGITLLVTYSITLHNQRKRT